jgi:hypothetical protein
MALAQTAEQIFQSRAPYREQVFAATGTRSRVVARRLREEIAQHDRWFSYELAKSYQDSERAQSRYW